MLLCLEDDIMVIQDKLGIVGYTNQEMAEEADKNARAYLRKFEEFHGPLEDGLDVIWRSGGKENLVYRRDFHYFRAFSSTIA